MAPRKEGRQLRKYDDTAKLSGSLSVSLILGEKRCP